jgi:hypothetical protein
MTLVHAIVAIGLIQAGDTGYMFPDDAKIAESEGKVKIIATNVKEKETKSKK